MKNQQYFSLLLALFALAAFGRPAEAQQLRPERTLFIAPHVGVTSYMGDHNKAFFGDAFSVDGQFPYALGLELGYQFSPAFALSAGYQFGNYPLINRAGRDTDQLADTPTDHHTLQFFGRYTFGGATARVAPYLLGGGHVTLGDTELFGTTPVQTTSETAYGPMLGLGLDFVLSNQVSLFLEGKTHMSFPDEAVDGRSGDRFGSFDMLSTLGLGLKINFKPAVTPVQVLSIDGPTRLQTGQAGTYTARTNDDKASRPVDYTWSFGDGKTAPGMTATHTFDRAGTYTVTFTARNAGGADSRSLTVVVADPPVAASIVTMNADPRNPDTETPVRFSATVRGDQPITYAWDFGDGAASADQAPSHSYDQAGTYNVSLTVTNAAGTDSRTMTVTVRPYEAEICSEVEEMNAVYFGRNSSTLTAEGRGLLEENLSILRECPNMNARVVGWSAPGERNPQRLSEDRARAVEQFYVQGGISASRLISTGRGAAVAVTSKKDGAAQYQRVDTIPVR